MNTLIIGILLSGILLGLIYILFIKKSIVTTPATTIIPTTTTRPITTTIQPNIQTPSVDYVSNIKEYTYEMPICVTTNCESLKEDYGMNIININTIESSGILVSIEFFADIELKTGKKVSSFKLAIGKDSSNFSCENSYYCNGPPLFPESSVSDTKLEYTDTPEKFINKGDQIKLIIYSESKDTFFKLSNIHLSVRILPLVLF